MDCILKIFKTHTNIDLILLLLFGPVWQRWGWQRRGQRCSWGPISPLVYRRQWKFRKWHLKPVCSVHFTVHFQLENSEAHELWWSMKGNDWIGNAFISFSYPQQDSSCLRRVAFPTINIYSKHPFGNSVYCSVIGLWACNSNSNSAISPIYWGLGAKMCLWASSHKLT
jgi:hypothetical protein